MTKILVTGSEGLVGSHLCRLLIQKGYGVVRIDIRGLSEHHGDVRDLVTLRSKMLGVAGIVHLAAVSRVVWGEQNPELCRSVNIDGTAQVIKCALEQQNPPWILFSSSREVYGEGSGKIEETAPFAPCSIYGHTKVAGEELLIDARDQGLRTGIVRLSNVYGRIQDHADRVIPAFVKAAVNDQPLYVEGSYNCYDFTHLHDTVDGILRYAELLQRGSQVIPPIQLLTGISTSLGELAELVVKITQSNSKIVESPPRDYGSGVFSGINLRAQQLLGWLPKIRLEDGISSLAKDFHASKVVDNCEML